MPENQNFYIIQHGIRLSGMPAWKQAFSDSEMWQVTTFLSHMDKLPPDVSAAWKTAAGGAQRESSVPYIETGKERQEEHGYAHALIKMRIWLVSMYHAGLAA